MYRKMYLNKLLKDRLLSIDRAEMHVILAWRFCFGERMKSNFDLLKIGRSRKAEREEAALLFSFNFLLGNIL